jgi:TRAP-type transport system periplasmic protein
MKGKKELSVVLGICLGVFLISWCSVALAAPIEMKITTVQLRQQQMGEGIERLAKYINTDPKLKDKVRVRTYPAAQLYTGQEEIQAVIKGEIQMAYVIGSAVEPIDTSMELLKLPFLFPDFDTLYKVLDGPWGRSFLPS